jgi:prolyl-tRNA synthetase
MVLAETGEDQIINCTECDYAANLERAEIKPPRTSSEPEVKELNPITEVDTPGIKTVEDVTAFLSILPSQLIKSLIFVVDGQETAALVRGDHELNEVKLKGLLGAETVELAPERVVEEITGAPMGFAGPVGLNIKIVADNALKGMSNFVTGGNRKDLHLRNVNMKRDFEVDLFGDLRVITSRDSCPRCGRKIEFGRGIEVGHIFKLGTKYSEALKAVFLNRQGKETPIIMGCYGIGVGRTVAAAIEQNHDKNGIIFPAPIAPFEVIILPLQMHNTEVVEAAEKIYTELSDIKVDTLLDDRDERAGVKFNDADLLGIPIRITVGVKGIKDGQVEIKLRSETESFLTPINNAASSIKEKVEALNDSPQ